MRMITKEEFKQWQVLPVLAPDVVAARRDSENAGRQLHARGSTCEQLRPATTALTGTHLGGGRLSPSTRVGNSLVKSLRAKTSQRTDD